jgi:hypothetical protein
MSWRSVPNRLREPFRHQEKEAKESVLAPRRPPVERRDLHRFDDARASVVGDLRRAIG